MAARKLCETPNLLRVNLHRKPREADNGKGREPEFKLSTLPNSDGEREPVCRVPARRRKGSSLRSRLRRPCPAARDAASGNGLREELKTADERMAGEARS